MNEIKLIFIISQPRAGSTLLQNLLGRHPKIHTTPESWLLLNPLFALRENGHTAEYNSTLAHTALFDFCNTLDEGIANYDEAVRKMAFHLYGTACIQANKSIFVDKTPRYYHILPELLRVFQNAKFVLLFRNPLAVLNSQLNTHVKGHWVLLSRYRQDLLTAPNLITQVAQNSHSRVQTLRYEDLVTDPRKHLTNLSDFLEIEFRSDMLSYNSGHAKSGHMGDSTGILHYDRPSPDRINQWHNMAYHAQTRHFALSYIDALGSETIANMGYDASELRSQIEKILSTQGKIEITWQQLFKPDASLQRRLYLIELALLEHRRIVHTLQKFVSRIKS